MKLDRMKLKSETTRVTQIKAEVDLLIHKQSIISSEINEKRKTIASIEASIKQLKQSTAKIIVSEHAILRYLERTYNLDLDSIQNLLLSSLPEGATNLRLKIKDLVYVVKNGVLVTVLNSSDKNINK